jgi:hypothetical protein
VFPVRYELDSYILFRRNSVFKGIIRGLLLYLPRKNPEVFCLSGPSDKKKGTVLILEAGTGKVSPCRSLHNRSDVNDNDDH